MTTLTDRRDAVERLLDADLDDDALEEALEALGMTLRYGYAAGIPDVPCVEVSALGIVGTDEGSHDAARNWLADADACLASRRAFAAIVTPDERALIWGAW